jgi:TetR/AcrR family transcriptional regulator, regulator of cefoperazone and chloramphenicol sensitivity
VTVSVGTQRRSQEQRTSQTRAELVTAAVRCINKIGYARATTREIAKYAQLSPGALQYQFGGKDGLMIAVILDMRTRLTDALMPAPEALSCPVGERVDLLIEQYWSVVSGDHYQAVMQIMLGAVGDSNIHTEITTALDEAARELDDHWMGSFSDLNRDPADVARTRRVVLAALRGFALRGLNSDRDPSWGGERRELGEMTRQRLLA